MDSIFNPVIAISYKLRYEVNVSFPFSKLENTVKQLLVFQAERFLTIYTVLKQCMRLKFNLFEQK